MPKISEGGGPAFPCAATINDSFETVYEGMTLRDFLAVHAKPIDSDKIIHGEAEVLVGPYRLQAEDYKGRLLRRAKMDAAWRYLWTAPCSQQRRPSPMTDYNLPWANISVWTSSPGEVILMFPRKHLGPTTITLTVPLEQHEALLTLMRDYKDRFVFPPLPPREPATSQLPPDLDPLTNLDLEF